MQIENAFEQLEITIKWFVFLFPLLNFKSNWRQFQPTDGELADNFTVSTGPDHEHQIVYKIILNKKLKWKTKIC